MSAAPCAALVPYLGHGDDGAAAWARLAPGERRRTAMQAARDHDGLTLWSLTEAWLRTFGMAGATVAPGTVRSYRCGVHALLEAWTTQDLLRPDLEAATIYIRLLERRGLAPSTIQARVAAGRGLYAGLRWCRAVTIDPFAECRVCPTTRRRPGTSACPTPRTRWRHSCWRRAIPWTRCWSC